jgi:HEAT repeat protein
MARTSPKGSISTQTAIVLGVGLVLIGVGGGLAISIWNAPKPDPAPPPIIPPVAPADVPVTPVDVPDSPPPPPAGPVVPELPPERPHPGAEQVDALVEVIKAGRPADRVTAAHRIAKLAHIAGRAVPALLAALEGADPELNAALTAALNEIGPPPREYVGLLVDGLQSKSDAVRQYAVHVFAERSRAPEEAIPALVGLLGDPHAKVRAHAAEALERIGAKARPLALAPLVARAADLDPAAQKAAAKAVRALGPPDSDDEPALRALLTDKSAHVRTAALVLIRPLETTGDQASAAYAPLLKDPTPELRLSALEGLLAFPDSVPALSDRVLHLLGDSDRGVRTAAIRAAGLMPGVAGILDKLTAARRTEAAPELRDALAAAVVALSAPQPGDVPSLRAVLVDAPHKTRQAAADKLGALGKAAAPAVDDLIALATSADANLRGACLTSALRALAAIGPHAKAAAPLAKATFEDKDAPVEARQAAVAVLAASGPDGVAQLKDATINRLPDPVKASMCIAFAAVGPEAKDIHTWMIDAAETIADVRSAVGDALVRAATDESALELLKRTDVFRTGMPGEPEHRYTVGYRKWALQTLEKMDLAKILTPKTRHEMEKRLKLRAEDTDTDIARVAAAILKKLKE